MIISIERADKQINNLCKSLPEIAIEQFTRKCLIDEIVITNNIEGVHSTRKEINAVLDDLSKKDKKKRFDGLIRKYIILMNNGNVDIETCSDIRKIYDDIFLNEIQQYDTGSLPDGKIFRKESVSVYSPTDKEIHTGLYPEEKIISVMNASLRFLNIEETEPMFRIAVFHYLFGYIHPFYDGNGRTSRFISSYLLSKHLNPLIGYRISYTVKENQKKYYDAFKICNDPKNRGDLSPFVSMFLEIIKTSMLQLCEALEKRAGKYRYYNNIIEHLPHSHEKGMSELYSTLITASMFSEKGITRNELSDVLEISPNTLLGRLKKIPEKMLSVKLDDKKYYYSLNLDATYDQ